MPQRSVPSFRASMQSDGTLEMLVYGDIADDGTIAMLESYGCSTDGFVSAMLVKRQIEAAGRFSKIAVRINSPGGVAFEGIAIYNLLRAQSKPIAVFVDGIAASAASIVAMAGDTITMGRNAMMMIHPAHCSCYGTAADMRKTAALLDKVTLAIGKTYSRTGKSDAEISALMDAETWMGAEECLSNGFCTAVAADDNPEPMARARSFKALKRFKNVPKNLNLSLYEARAALAAKKLPAEARSHYELLVLRDKVAALGK